ncbi:GHKL domain-containing protein [Paenibacillus sp. LHD-38]|uniref:GHKL domain-containing protein n=1 Tax=Paenibacillus sp. LHD-38 TaxID=3072143 RepID=UPI00280EF100|nr:GHKL domain-containing protein [Paenibacillus sp. LHD-38]MDQ8735780.1 GHKL domain-containing protein [Paenibacillus sp. LHD-38]
MKIQLSTKKRMIYFTILSITVLSLLTGIKLYFSYHSTSKSAEITLAKQYTEIAEDIADGLDIETYKRFLQSKADDEHRKKLKLYLEEYHKRINALYVYILLLDDTDVSKVMVSAFPPQVMDMPIGFPCTVPAAQVRLAKQGSKYSTDLIHDELTGSYLSVGVPFFDDNGVVLGVLGIDISTKELEIISHQVIRNNMFIFGMDILFALVLVAVVLFLNKWYRARLNRDLQESEKMYISELGKVVDTIKSSRHDLMNHFQVLNGLMDIGKHDQAHDYLKQLTEESKTLHLSLSVKNPMLLVLFKSKWELAHSKNIRISFETDYNAFDRLASMDLVKLFSNLLDNAIEAVETYEGELPRDIHVSCKAINGSYQFAVLNPAVLTDLELGEFFQTGFTTKHDGQGVHGNGLSIVKRTVEKYKGDMVYRYEDGKLLMQIVI